MSRKWMVAVGVQEIFCQPGLALPPGLWFSGLDDEVPLVQPPLSSLLASALFVCHPPCPFHPPPAE